MKLDTSYKCQKPTTMSKKLFITICVFLSVFFVFHACEKDDDTTIITETDDDDDDDNDEEEENLTIEEILEKEYVALGNDPLSWSDDELQFLDEIADKKIIGLGEATHGTAEFFQAKHRIFKYLVENHDYKIFAIEADFGESIYINEAVQNGDVATVKSLMLDYMHFWTWSTEEVREMIEWMCEYNIGKSDDEKIHYVGNDCQFNTYHPDIAKEYLVNVQASFLEYANEVLNEAKLAYDDEYESYNTYEFINEFIPMLEAFQDTVEAHKDELIAASSEKEYELFHRTVLLVKQVSEVRYYYEVNPYNDYRDKYMAENTSWMYDYFDGEKIVVWAHNGHIANDLENGRMGGFLYNEHLDDYTTIGFLFSKGSFTAVGHNGYSYTGLQKHSIDTIPYLTSLNGRFSEATDSTFQISIKDLMSYTSWDSIFNEELTYFHIGAVFNGNPTDYYYSFDKYHYDRIIYFENTTASDLLDSF